jgi:hypothetical protein
MEVPPLLVCGSKSVAVRELPRTSFRQRDRAPLAVTTDVEADRERRRPIRLLPHEGQPTRRTASVTRPSAKCSRPPSVQVSRTAEPTSGVSTSSGHQESRSSVSAHHSPSTENIDVTVIDSESAHMLRR